MEFMKKYGVGGMLLKSLKKMEENNVNSNNDNIDDSRSNNMDNKKDNVKKRYSNKQFFILVLMLFLILLSVSFLAIKLPKDSARCVLNPISYYESLSNEDIECKCKIENYGWSGEYFDPNPDNESLFNFSQG